MDSGLHGPRAGESLRSSTAAVVRAVLSTLQSAQDPPESAPESLAIAAHSDTSMQLDADSAIAAAEVLSRYDCNRSKTVGFITDAHAARSVATCLGASVATEGSLACGTPLGSREFIDARVQQRCNKTIALTEKLIGLPLDCQTKWTVLSQCVQHRRDHVLRKTRWCSLAEPMRKVEAARLRAHSHIIKAYALTDQQEQQALDRPISSRSTDLYPPATTGAWVCATTHPTLQAQPGCPLQRWTGALLPKASRSATCSVATLAAELKATLDDIHSAYSDAKSFNEIL